MKLKYIEGPYGFARDVKALEIFENAVNNVEWLDEMILLFQEIW